MRYIRYRDRDTSANSALYVAVGALAGLAAGMLIAQRYGGLSAIGERVSRGVRDRIGDRFGETLGKRFGADREREAAGFRDRGMEAHDYDEEPLDDEEYGDEGEELEERVLEAFRNDLTLAERAIDIGAIGRGIIELTGWVHADDESHHAVTVTRGVPGVDTVVNRLVVREEEERLDDSSRRYRQGEAEPSARWEGQGVGTGRTRQGTSGDPGRHANPKPELEERWQDTGKAVRAAAEDLDGIVAERRQREQLEGDRTGGSPVSPSGVPKSDHVADPASAEPILREQSGRVTRAD